MSPLQRFFKLLQPDKQEIFSIYIYAIFSSLVNLSLPLGIQAIINFVSGGQISTSWIILVCFVLIGIAVNGGLQVMQLSIVENLQRKIFTRSAFEFAYRIPHLKMEAIGNQYPPELMNRFFDTLSIQKGLSKILVDFPTATLQVFFGFILLSFYHSFFIIFSFLLVAILVLIFWTTGPRGMKTSLYESKYKYQVAYWLQEVARTMETFKLAGKTDLPLKRTDKLVQGYLEYRKQHFRVLVLQYLNLVGFKVIVSGALLILGGILVMDQRMNVGQFVAAEILIVLMINSIEKLILSMENIYDVLTAVEKIGNITDLALEEDKGRDLTQNELNQGISISLKNVSYQFAETTKPAIKDFSMDIAAGEKVCISGASGSGKTLLLRLISGLYTNFSGSISYNKIPMGNLKMDCIRGLIGDNLTKETIFSGTITENISTGRAEISLEDIQKAVEVVGLTDYLESLKDGYDTFLLPEGRTLPSNIATKIVLARCIVGEPPVILVEEGVDNLSMKEKEHILEYLLDKNNPSTVIVAANNPTFKEKYDRIISLK